MRLTADCRVSVSLIVGGGREGFAAAYFQSSDNGLDAVDAVLGLNSDAFDSSSNVNRLTLVNTFFLRNNITSFLPKITP